MNIFAEVQDIAALAKKIERGDEEREEVTYEDEAPRKRARPLKKNKVYTERELAIYFDNKDR